MANLNEGRSSIDTPGAQTAPSFFRRYENQVVLVLALAGGVAALDAQAIFYLMPFVASDLSFSNSQVGIIGSAVLIGWSIAGFIVARISDRVGKRRPFLIGAFLCFAAFSGLSAIATSFMGLLLARFAIGLAEGPVIPVKQAIVIAASTPGRRGLNMGIVQNFGAQLVGSLIAPIVVVALAQKVGWRAAFLLAGIPGLIVAWLIWRHIREPEARDGSANLEKEPRARMLTAIMHRNIVLCVCIGICAVGWFFILLNFLPLWFTRSLGFSASTMSVLVSMIGAAGAISAVVVPGLSDRIGRKRAMLIFCSIGLIAPLGAITLGSNPWLIGASLFVGCLMTGTFPLFMSIVPQESVAPEQRATATATVIAVAQIVGGAVGPIVGGMMADRFGLQAPLILAIGLAALSCFLVLGLRETAAFGRPAGDEHAS